jgi:hypothetical protein
MSSLFPELVQPSPQDPTPFDLNLARTLAKTVQAHHRIQRPFSVRHWANHIQKLRTVDKIDQDRIQRVFDWYIIHFGEPGMYWAFSGEGFRQKFIQIEAKMNLYRKQHPEEGLVITDKVKELSKRIRNDKWPKGARDRLLPIIQISYNQYTHFKKRLFRLHTMLEDGTVQPKYKGITSHLVLEVFRRLPSVETMLEQWFRRLFQQVSKWDEWNGGVNWLVLDPNRDEFKREVAQVVEDYTGSPKRTSQLLEVLNEEIPNGK